MSVIQVARVAAASLGLSALALAAPITIAVADDGPSGRSKAGIEYAERQSEPQAPKRQIEQRELEQLRDREVSGDPAASLSAADTSGWEAAAWQLALSALAGGAMTAGGIAVVYRFRHHAPSAVA